MRKSEKSAKTAAPADPAASARTSRTGLAEAAAAADVPAAASELEIKLAIARDEAARLAAHPLLLAQAQEPMKSEPMCARYYDTDDAQLAKSRMSLRVRREGARWVQTFKTSSGAALALSSRGEWEQPLDGPQLDWDALRGTPLAELAGFDTLPQRLRCVFTVKFERRSWLLTLADGTRASASLDIGEIVCGRGAARRSAPISEFELEFIAGEPRALWKFAGRLARDLTLTPLAESKGARGHALASDAVAAPRKTELPRIERSQRLGRALAASLGAPLSALEHNLRHLDAADIEYVHQARVALRRLRSVLRAFAKPVRDKRVRRRMKALDKPLGKLGRLLGAARDADVFIERMLSAPENNDATTRGDAQAAAPQQPLGALQPDALGASAAACRAAACRELERWLASRAAGRLLLAAERLVFEAAQMRAPKRSEPLAAQLGALLRKQHDRVQRAAESLTRQSAAERHRLRIEVKRLRYLLDSAHTLWPKDAAKLYRRALEALQQRLGEFNDAAVACRMLDALHADAALREAARAHERARLDDDLPQVAHAIAALDLAAVPWRRGMARVESADEPAKP